MDKRLAKRHKRQVTRAKQHVKTSEPDVRTPEEIKAAREASRPAGGHTSTGTQSNPGAGVRSNVAQGTGSAAKTSV